VRPQTAPAPAVGRHRISPLTTVKIVDEVMAEELRTDAGSADPRTGPRAVASLRRLAEQLESLQVDRARDLGWSWTQIAAELGASKQAPAGSCPGTCCGSTTRTSPPWSSGPGRPSSRSRPRS
jgi:hypothetical protein